MELIVVIWFISVLVVCGLILYRSVARTKSAAHWLKGFNLKQKKTVEEVYTLLNRLQHPLKKTVDYSEVGKIVIKTEVYDFPVEISEDKDGNTVVGLLVNWGTIGKRKRKKVAYCWDELYHFLQAEVEGSGIDMAMKKYERNAKINKMITISSIACVALFVVAMLFSS